MRKQCAQVLARVYVCEPSVFQYSQLAAPNTIEEFSRDTISGIAEILKYF